MSSQVVFYRKNRIDLDYEQVQLSTSQDNDFSQFMRNRSLLSGWVTNDSVDSDNTTVTIDLVDPFDIDTLGIIDTNVKSYLFEYYNGSSWVSLVDVTDNAKDSVFHNFSTVNANEFRLTIRGTQTADVDKLISRLFITERIGQFEFWPKIKKPMIDRGRITRRALSGKYNIGFQVGSFSCSLEIGDWRSEADLALIETLYREVEGFEVQLGGADEEGFFFLAESYRAKDVYLMQLKNEYSPEFAQYIYSNGLGIELDLVEVVR